MRMFLKQFVNWFCLLFYCLLINYSVQLSKDDTFKLDRTIELFTNNIYDELSLQLKCKFDSNKTSNEEVVNEDQDENDYLHLSASNELITWYKYDPTSESFNQVKRPENQIESFKYSSNLRFKLSNELQSIAGIYLCRLNSMSNQQVTAIKNFTDFNIKSKYNSQFLQKISINEVLNSIEAKSQFKLNHHIKQITSSRIVIEIDSLVLFNNSSHFKLIYSLTNLNNSAPVIRGTIDASNLLDSNKQPIYLIFDALNSKAHYSLLIYLKSNPVQPKPKDFLNHVRLALNTTIETLARNKSKHITAFQMVSKKFNEYDSNDSITNDYELDDEDEEEEEDDYIEEEDDEYDYNSADTSKKSERIINCDLDANSVNTNKIITINYLSLRMKKLISYLFKNNTTFFDYKNKTNLNEISTNFNNFKDFFSLFHFNKGFPHYSVYDECIKEFKTKSNFINSKPLCLFNLDTLWESFNKYNDLNNEYFSVQTSIFISNTKLNSNSLIYVASACHLKRRDAYLVNFMLPENKTKETTTKSSVNNRIDISNQKQPQIGKEKKFNIISCHVENNRLDFTVEYAFNEKKNYSSLLNERGNRKTLVETNITEINQVVLERNNNYAGRNSKLLAFNFSFPNSRSKTDSLVLNCSNKMNNENAYNRINSSISESNNYKIGLFMAALSALILLMIGLLICVIVKRKYGFGPDYISNFKNNFLFKSRNSSSLNENSANNTTHTVHSSIFKKNFFSDNSQTQQPQYQLPSANSRFNNNLLTSMPSSHNTEIMSKNPTFNYVDNDAINADLFDAYVQRMHVDGDFGFAQLYEEISNATRAYSYSSEASLFDYNRCKNRYSNILTYDHSRVKISSDEKDETSGYINANYVDGYQKQNAYIATQGPMPNTFGDFWKMIWEKNCSIIVMITNVKEKGRIKCDQYWPDEGFEYYGNIQATHLHTINLSFYTKRIFTLKMKNNKKRDSKERLVYQYHFTDWPDHGVPFYIMPVLSFIKKSSRSNPELGGPIVVHCSAGVGRTGTYIVIDAMMNQIKHKNTVNIHNFLKHIRHQRNYLVQTEEQFIFIYDCILEWIKSGETDLNEHNYKSYLNSLSCVLNDNGLKLIDRQFELITEYKPKDYQISAANMSFNIEKNRSQNIVPVNNSRVLLSKKPGIEGSEYINATYLHGSNRQDEFIITQYPLKETKNSFWQMIWENNSNQIVVLNSDETEHCDFYWSPIGECMKCDNFSVTLKEENFDIDFVLRDFQLKSNDDDFEFNCRMISACYWPDSCAPIKISFELINKVRCYRSQSMTACINNMPNAIILTPIVVHDLYGGHRAATFCALYTFQDLIQLENSVNVYEIAKMFHLKRPEIWNNQTNIMFLYEAVECLFEEMQLNNRYQLRNLNTENSNFPFSQQLQQPSNNIQTNTLPNLSNYLISQQPVNNTQLLQRNHSNDAIGARIQSFIKQRQDSNDHSDPLSAIPLTNTNQSLKQQDQMNIMLLNSPIINDLEAIAIDTSVPSKNSFIDILPSFLINNKASENSGQSSTRKSFIKHFNRRSSGVSNTSSSNGRRDSNGVHRNSRAIKFMNSVMTKSASFKRAIFSQSSQESSSAQHLQQDNQSKKKQLDPKPSMMIALASASSSSSSGSSTTVVQTTTESSLSSKSANLVQSSSCSVSPNSVINNKISTNSPSNTNLNISICTINTPTTTISQLNKTTSQSNLKLN